jgi:positive regulator of sigma E activity
LEPLQDAPEVGLDGVCGAVTVTVAEADLLESALLVAITVSVPALLGAVYAPEELMVPSAADQVTDLLEAVPWTVALNWAVPPVLTDVEAGETATEVTTGVTGAAVTVTLAEADLLVSATLVAVTVSVPALDGAVYWPPAVMVPSKAFQVTDLLDVDPWTEALNDKVPVVIDDAVAGLTVTEVTGLVGELGPAVIETVADALWVGWATLVAVTIAVPAVDGAV